MIDREKVQQVRKQLQDLKLVSLQEGHDMLAYLIQVAEIECEDLIEGRFERDTRIEEFAPALQ